MKKSLFFGFVLLMSLFSISCNSQAAKDKEATVKEVSGKVEVYYFHYTRRCVTCKTVEDNTKLAVDALNLEKTGGDSISYHVLNLDDEANKAIANKFKAGGQALLVTIGDKKADITGNAFMNANNPVRIKAEISKVANQLLLQ